MKYLLDTNTCIELMKGHPGCRIRFGEAVEREDRLCLSSIVEFELAYGVANSGHRHRAQNQQRLDTFLRFAFEKVTFSREDGLVSGLIRSQLRQAGTSIGAYDLLIAGQALNNHCILVTDNVREFSRVDDLKWTNWKGSLP